MSHLSSPLRLSVPKMALLAACLISGSSARAESLVAFTRGNAIYTANASDGKNIKRICSGESPAISNNGRWLAYTRRDDSKSKAGEEGQRDGKLILRELASGQETILLPAGKVRLAYGALWSPDDQWIAFNAYNGDFTQVAVVHPDGTGLRSLTDALEPRKCHRFIVGWNYHDHGALIQASDKMYEINPENGKVAWQRSMKEFCGQDDASDDLRCTVTPDGKRLVSTRYVERDEFKNLDGPSAYLFVADFPGGTPRRVTPKKFDVGSPWLSLDGGTVLLRGFGEGDVTTRKHSDEVKMKTHIYRLDLASGKLTLLADGEGAPSASRE